MSDVDPELLKALEELVGGGVPRSAEEATSEPDDEFLQRLEAAERLVNEPDG